MKCGDRIARLFAPERCTKNEVRGNPDFILLLLMMRIQMLFERVADFHEQFLVFGRFWFCFGMHFFFLGESLSQARHHLKHEEYRERDNNEIDEHL